MELNQEKLASDRQGMKDQVVRQDAARIVAALGSRIIEAGNPIIEDRPERNALLLLSGDYGGFKISKADTHIQGVLGTRVLRRVIVDASCIIDRVHFFSPDGNDNVELLVDVTNPTATVFFRDCAFEKRVGQTAACVRVVALARAHFIGCLFGPVGLTTGAPVENLGLAANVFVSGSNVTGRLHILVTPGSGITT
jgi:hypothetical protein